MSGYVEALRRETAVAEFESVPNCPAVFLLWPDHGRPMLSRTGALHKRLARLLRPREAASRLADLRSVVQRIEWYATGSRLESSYLLYRLAKRHFPSEYEKVAKLRYPAYVRLHLGNAFPRISVSARIEAGSSHFGPFRSRAAAEAFQNGTVDLFQLRRCTEELQPGPDHPGCIYGEMNACLRPCQMVVGPDEYRTEAERVHVFLASGGRSLSDSVALARDRFSEEMQFEEAARQHRRLQRIDEVLRLRDELARDIDRMCGVAITHSTEPGNVLLWFIDRGGWREPVQFTPAAIAVSGAPTSLDHQLREAVRTIPAARAGATERREHLALLARWYYSSWRDGEWIEAESWESVPYRRFVNAVARTLKAPAR